MSDASMSSVFPASPCARPAPRSTTGSCPRGRVLRFWMRRPPSASFFAAARRRARPVPRSFEVELPVRLGPAGQRGERAALWLGPDEWLLMSEGQSVEALSAALEAGVEGAPHSLVDASTGRLD